MFFPLVKTYIHVQIHSSTKSIKELSENIGQVNTNQVGIWEKQKPKRYTGLNQTFVDREWEQRRINSVPLKY